MSTNVPPLGSKSPAATKFYGIDVTNRLFSGDSLDLTRPPTATSNPPGLTITSANYLAGNLVVALVGGGQPATLYSIVFTWATAKGETDAQAVQLPVEAV